MLNQAQLRLYRAEWGKCRRALRQFGRSPSEADAERMKIHREACGVEKSSTELTNAQLDRVLAIFWTWSQPASLDAQLRQENQTGIRMRWNCNHLLDLYSEIDPADWMSDEQKRNYVDALFRKLNPDVIQDPDWCEFDPWDKVLCALVYRYDQLVRKALGKARRKLQRWEKRPGARKRVEFHPEYHHKHLQQIRAYQEFLVKRQEREQELVLAGHEIDEGDPF